MLEIRDIHKTFPGGVQALRGLSLHIHPGESVGLVGESGCGKSTLGKVILRLEEPNRGRLIMSGEDYTCWKGERMRTLRRHLQIIFQDSAGSLNPRHTIGQSIAEPLENFFSLTRQEKRSQIVKLLHMVGLEAQHIERYSHELSGGQRQRVGIARALALHPKAIVCDEPIASLDVSIQAQIIALLKRLKTEFGLAYLFISHDIASVRRISDRVAVMYAGQLVEILPSQKLASHARHPYTYALLSALPVPDPSRRRLSSQRVCGEPPNPARLPTGCAFHPRCPRAQPLCQEVPPELTAGRDGHLACHYPLPPRNAM